jgi:hypothetical protein
MALPVPAYVAVRSRPGATALATSASRPSHASAGTGQGVPEAHAEQGRRQVRRPRPTPYGRVVAHHPTPLSARGGWHEQEGVPLCHQAPPSGRADDTLAGVEARAA